MSAYIIDNTIYQKVADYLFTMIKKDAGAIDYFLKKNEVNPVSFMNKVIRLNNIAVAQRYSSAFEPTEITYLESASSTQVDMTTLMQTIKSVDSMIYQCSEEVASQMEDYKLLKELSYLLKTSYINQLDAYDKAEWA